MAGDVSEPSSAYAEPAEIARARLDVLEASNSRSELMNLARFYADNGIIDPKDSEFFDRYGKICSQHEYSHQPNSALFCSGNTSGSTTVSTGYYPFSIIDEISDLTSSRCIK